MAKFLADQNQLAFVYEPDTYGVGSKPSAGTLQWIGLVQEHTPDETTNVIPIRYQGSTDRNVDQFADGPLDYTGTFTYFPQDWKFLGFAIGKIDDSSNHDLTETNSDDLLYAGSTTSLPSFTLVDSKKTGTIIGSNFERVFKGCQVDTYGVTWTQGEVVSCDVGYVAQAGSLSTDQIKAVTPTTTRPHMWSDAVVYMSGTGYVGSISNFIDMSLTITNNLEPGHYVNGSRMIKESLPLNRDLELTATMVMDNTTASELYDDFYIAGSEFITNISSIGTPGSVFITLSGCKITDMEVPSPVEGTNEQTMTIVPQHIAAEAIDSISLYYSR